MERTSFTVRLFTFSSVLLVLVAVLLISRPEIYTYFSTRFLGGTAGDAGLYVWLVRSFLFDPWQALRYESSAMYPYPHTLAWSDNFFLPSACAFFLSKIGLTPIEAYNSVLTSALVLNGATLYLVSRALKLPPVWSLCSGVSAELSSVLVGNIGHPQLVFFFWLPLIWLPWISGKVTPWRLLLSGISVSAAFYCSVYYALFGVVGIIALGAVRATSTSLRGLFCLLLGLIPIIPSVYPYLAIRAAFGGRNLFEPSYFAASGLSYFSFPPLNWVYGFTSTFSHGEAFLAPSYLVLLFIVSYSVVVVAVKRSTLRLSLVGLLVILCITSSYADASALPELLVCLSAWASLLVAAILIWRSQSSFTLLLWLATVFFILSFGPGGTPDKQEAAWAPFSALFILLPGFESIRASGRLGIVVAVFAFPLTFSLLYHLVTRRVSSRISACIPVCVCALVVVENWITHVPIDELPPPPTIFETLRSVNIDRSSAIILPFSPRQAPSQELSWTEFASLHTLQMNWSVGRNTPIVNGYSGQRSRIQGDLIRETFDFPSARSILYFNRICRLKYIVMLASRIPSWNQQQFHSKLNELENPPKIISTDDQGNMLLELASDPTPSSKDSPYYTAQGEPMVLEVTSTQSEVPCEAKVVRWEKSGSQVTKLLLQSLHVTNTPTVVHISPQPSSYGTPNLVSIEGSSCSVVVRCVR